MNRILEWPAVWGFLGALIYAGTLLIAALFGDNPAQGNRKRRALAEFVLGIVCGPIFAEGIGPTIARMWPALEPRAIFLGIGLAANYVWPIAVRALGSRVEREISRRDREPNDPPNP